MLIEILLIIKRYVTNIQNKCLLLLISRHQIKILVTYSKHRPPTPNVISQS